MTDEIVTTATPATTEVSTDTSSSPQVARPFVSVKPYDDDMLEEYAEESEKEAQAEEKPTVTENKVEPEDSETDTAPEKVEPETPAVEDTILKQTINGKEVEFKVKDAIQAFVKQEEFNRNMDRRVMTVAQREKRFSTEMDQFKSKVDKVIEVSRNGDFVTGIRALAKLAKGSSDLDVVEFEKQYFNQLDKVREVYGKMTPEQQEAYFAKRKAADLEAEVRASREEKSVQADKSQLQERVATLQQQYALPENEFWENYKVLESEVGEGKRFKSPNDIQPEDVVRYSLAVRHEEKVLTAGYALGVTDDAILDEVSKITVTNPELSVDDIKQIIRSSGIATTASPEVVGNLNRKAGKSNTRFSQASSTKKKENLEGYDEETLEELYRKSPRVYARPVR